MSFALTKASKKFCAGQMRKMDDIIGNLFEFAPDFFASLRAQFDCFAGAALQDAKDSPVGLQIDFVLSRPSGTGRSDDKSEKKRVTFHG